MGILFYLNVLLSLFSVSFSQKEKALQFLNDYNNMAPLFKSITEAEWRHATNITDYNTKIKKEAVMNLTRKMNEIRKMGSQIDLTGVDDDIRRQFRILLNSKTISNITISKRFIEVGTKMSDVYSTGTIPYDPNLIKSINVKSGVTELRLNQHLHAIMAKSTDPDELAYVWKSWRDSVGPKSKDFYTEYVRLNNIGAREHGFQDAGEYRRKKYEVDNLEQIAEQFLEDMNSIYLEIHGYARYRLSKVYPGVIGKDGLIPAHLLGDMWSQQWNNVYRHMIPFPKERPIDISAVLEETMTIKEMFQMAEQFFVSLGWQKLPQKFWTHSLFVEPNDRKVKCHASAWDFYDKDNGEPDVRVKMCTLLNQDDFNTVHHELGHNYYQLLYWNQPMVYRDGANPGFHEAVGEIMELSVQTPTHLKKVGLLKDISSTYEAEINFLLKSALDKIVFLPFGFLMDKWMWNVYNGNIKPDQYNTRWWEYRVKYQGIKPPVKRSENDFDPGAKMHIVNDVSYIRYFFARILQFVFHNEACIRVEHTGPLHKCSIYNSKAAGKALGDMLSLGRSKPWPEALKLFTGSPNISTKPIKQYYKPLIEWLKNYRLKEKYNLGWNTKI